VFTGLVEDLGTVAAVDRSADGARVTITSPLAHELGEGDSIAVNGVCLTAVGICDDRFGAFVMGETLRASSLDELDAGARVNLELPVKVESRLGGHIVQGHVDGVSLTVSAIDDDGFEISLIPETLARTTLGRVAAGTPVNLEVDVVAKYVEKLPVTRT
jgi:riboflavin synthase